MNACKGRMFVSVHPIGFVAFNESLDMFKAKNHRVQMIH